MPSYVYKCPECGNSFGIGLQKEFYCENCGTKMSIVNSFSNNQTENYPEVVKEPQEENQPEIELPKGLKLRDVQNPECQKVGNKCAIMHNKNLVCLVPSTEISSDDKYLELFKIKPCSKNPTQETLEVNEVSE